MSIRNRLARRLLVGFPGRGLSYAAALGASPGGAKFQLATLFRGGTVEGAAFDVEPDNSFTTHDGSTLATPGDSVGRVLDQRFRGERVKLIPADSFADGAPGWTRSPNPGDVWTFVEGEAVAAWGSGDGFQSIVRDIGEGTAGTLLKVVVNIPVYTSGVLRMWWGTGAVGLNWRDISGAGVHEIWLTHEASVSSTNLTLRSNGTSGNFTGTLASVSAELVPGNHALQSSSALRPLFGRVPLGGVRNVLLRSEDQSGLWSQFGDSDRNGGQIDFGSGGDTNRVQQEADIGQQRGGLDFTVSIFIPGAEHWTDPDAVVTLWLTSIFGDRQNFLIEEAGRWVHAMWTHPASTSTVVALAIYTDRPAVVDQYLKTQLEIGDTATPYQRVGTTALDVTESGVKSTNYARFDLSDDKLTATIPDGITNGVVIVAGTLGTWVEEGVTIAADGDFDIGVESATGCPAGILNATGADIVGWAVHDGPMTETEILRTVEFFKSEGAKGRLVEGPELVTNGDFSDGATGWALESGATVADGRGVFSGGASERLRKNNILSEGRFYRAEVEIVEFTSGSPAVQFASVIQSFPSTTLGVHRFYALMSGGANLFGIRGSSAIYKVDNVSLVAYIPEEDL